MLSAGQLNSFEVAPPAKHRHLDEPEPMEALDRGDYGSVQPLEHLVHSLDVSKTPFYDEIAGLPLLEALVKAARAEELEYMTTKLPVWQRGFSEDYVKSRGLKPVPTRFLDVNKGGWDSPDAMQIRSRLVVQETRRRSSIAADDIASVFSATPPIEALRFMLSQTMITKQGF